MSNPLNGLRSEMSPEMMMMYYISGVGEGHMCLRYKKQNLILCSLVVSGLITDSTEYSIKVSRKRPDRIQGMDRLSWISPYREWLKRGDFSAITCPACSIRHLLIVANKISISKLTGLRHLKLLEAGT